MMRSLKSLGYSFYKRLFKDKTEAAIFFTAIFVEIAFGLYLVYKWGFTFANNDAVIHLYIPRTVVDNGPHSNLANLGTVWLPMFHLLVMPLVLIDILYTTGVAGTIVNALATGGICIALYRLVGKRRLGILASALFLCNAFTFIYGATPMMEQAAIFFMTFAIYYFKNYWEKDDLVEFMKCSLALLFGTLTRYEVWVVALLVASFFLIKELRGRRFHRLSYLHFPFWGIFAWFFWNLAIFRDPLMFLHHPLVAPFVHLLFYFTNSISLTTTHVLMKCFMFSGALSLLAIFSATTLLIRRKASQIVVAFLLTSPILLHYFFSYAGVWSWAQTRFFYMGFPGLILTVLFSVNDEKRWLKPTILISIILVSLSYPMQLRILTTGSSNIIPSIPNIHFDIGYPLFFSAQIRELVTIKQRVTGSSILMGATGVGPSHFSVFTFTSPSSIIDAYDGSFYIEVMDKPWNHVSFVIIDKLSPGNPLLKLQNDYYEGKYFVYHYYNDEPWRTEFLKHYILILETENFLVFFH